MSSRRSFPVLLSLALFLTLLGSAQASPKTEVKGAAILDHPCGKVAIKHMGLIHDGKFEEATKLGTKEMQDQWKAMPADQRKMMTELMKATSEPSAQLASEIKAGGLLVVEGTGATVTVKKEHKDANGTTSETWTQNYVVDKGTCLITR
jgi:hypothetical protein